MILNTFILLNILLSFSTSRTMETPKETVLYLPKIRLKKSKKSSVAQWGNPIITSLFYIKEICDKNKIISEIMEYIKWYSFALKNTDFLNISELCLTNWHDFRIPTDHHWFLTSHQINLMQDLLTSSPYSGTYDRVRQIHYILKSKKDYRLFLTLPIEIRKCLTLMPKSEIEVQKQILPLERSLITQINVNRTIEVKLTSKKPLSIKQTQFVGSKPKPILPEEYKKNQKK